MIWRHCLHERRTVTSVTKTTQEPSPWNPAVAELPTLKPLELTFSSSCWLRCHSACAVRTEVLIAGEKFDCAVWGRWQGAVRLSLTHLPWTLGLCGHIDRSSRVWDGHMAPAHFHGPCFRLIYASCQLDCRPLEGERSGGYCILWTWTPRPHTQHEALRDPRLLDLGKLVAIA